MGQGLIYLGDGATCRADPRGGADRPVVRPGDPRDIAADRRRRFTPTIIADGIVEVCRSRVTMVYLLVMGLIGGPFIAYLATSRQIFQTSAPATCSSSISRWDRFPGRRLAADRGW